LKWFLYLFMCQWMRKNGEVFYKHSGMCVFEPSLLRARACHGSPQIIWALQPDQQLPNGNYYAQRCNLTLARGKWISWRASKSFLLIARTGKLLCHKKLASFQFILLLSDRIKAVRRHWFKLANHLHQIHLNCLIILCIGSLFGY
jgi:hypothetical protein